MPKVKLFQRVILGAAAAALAIGASAANFTRADTGMPQISSFIATPATINSGQSSTLSWSISNATSATIDNSVGAVAATSGSQLVVPSGNTTYTLTATNANGSVTATATVTISTAAGAGAPVINSFTISPTSLNSGQSATLSWNISGATTASISNGVGSVAATSGTQSVTPTANTTYVLSATNSNATSTATAVVAINSTSVSGMPVINSFTVSPTTINTGQSAVLSWNITNAISASINNGVGSVAATSGSQTVNPTGTTTYALSATNANGSATASATVTMNMTMTSPVPLGWIAIPRNGTGGTVAFSSPNFNTSTNTWNTTGNWIDCNGMIDNDSAHHTFDMGDTDPAHHLGMACNGSAEAWTPGLNLPGLNNTITTNPGSFPAAQWIVVQLTPANLTLIANALAANPNANLSALFPGQ